MQNNMWLIDAYELWNEFEKRYCDIDKGRSFANEYMPIYDVIRLDEIENGIALVRNAIPVDAVAIVRCKDCANSYVPHNGFARRCRKLNRLVGEMDFCSYGLTEEEYNEMERELVEMDICSDGERCE